jgi:hypothetical protein
MKLFLGAIAKIMKFCKHSVTGRQGAIAPLAKGIQMFFPEIFARISEHLQPG